MSLREDLIEKVADILQEGTSAERVAGWALKRTKQMGALGSASKSLNTIGGGLKQEFKQGAAAVEKAKAAGISGSALKGVEQSHIRPSDPINHGSPTLAVARQDVRAWKKAPLNKVINPHAP